MINSSSLEYSNGPTKTSEGLKNYFNLTTVSKITYFTDFLGSEILGSFQTPNP